MSLFSELGQYTDADHIWLGVGLLGQALFSARFIVQWLVSEKHKRSIRNNFV